MNAHFIYSPPPAPPPPIWWRLLARIGQIICCCGVLAYLIGASWLIHFLLMP